MTASELKSIINEMGGYDNVFSFVFDNQMCIYFKIGIAHADGEPAIGR